MVEVSGLRYTYPGNKDITIKGLDFTINSGEIFGFLGPSGAGKSTTQKIIIGLLKGFSGKINVNNRDLASLGYNYYEEIGVSFEMPNLFNKLTAMENLKFFASLYSNSTESPGDLLQLVGLGDKGNAAVGEYSKGMKMRLNFARSLLNKPEILFLDEPTSGLDPSNAKKIKDIILRKKKEGTTIFLTTHNMAVADDLCDRVAFLVEGAIPVIESPRELKIRYGKKVIRVEYRENNGTEMKEFPFNRIGEDPHFINLLKTKQIETIHSMEATLEDIFIEVTGKKLSGPENGGVN